MVARLVLLIVIGISSAISHAQASEICDDYRKNDPELYKLICTEGSAGTKPAGANSTFSDAFNINAGALPTEPSSYGFESIGSYLRADTSTLGGNYSLIKGYHRFGTGISTSGNNTFYGNDVYERLHGTPEVTSFNPQETSKGHFVDLNLGTSFLIYDPSDGPRARLGISARYNNITNTWGWGPGLMVSWDYFTIGAGYTHEQVSNTLPTLLFESFLVSAHVSLFELEYTVLNAPAQTNLSAIQILTLTTKLGRLNLTGAIRFLDYLSTGRISQTHFALQYMFNKSFSAGLLYNYIPGANSVGTQFFL
jgi:hypothetical protein